MHDDLFDFFYQAMPGYEEVGRRRILLGCWGAFQDPEVCNFQYRDMTEWGRAMFVTPGVVVDGKLVTNDLVDINLGIRILLGSSFYDDWEGQEMFVTRDPLGQPGRPPPSVEPAHDPAAAEARLRRQVQLGHVAALVRRHGPPGSRHRRRARSPGCGRRRCPGWSTSATSRPPVTVWRSTCPRPRSSPRSRFEWKIPQWSNTIERDRARTYFQAYAAGGRSDFTEKALVEVRAGTTKTWEPFDVPDEGIGCGFTEAVRGVLSHHMVIRERQDRQLPPVSADAWNANPRDCYGTPGPYEDAVAEHAHLRGERPRALQGDRHHANGAQLRPVPAVRGAHVPRQGQDAPEAALARPRSRTPTLAC